MKRCRWNRFLVKSGKTSRTPFYKNTMTLAPSSVRLRWPLPSEMKPSYIMRNISDILVLLHYWGTPSINYLLIGMNENFDSDSDAARFKFSDSDSVSGSRKIKWFHRVHIPAMHNFKSIPRCLKYILLTKSFFVVTLMLFGIRKSYAKNLFQLVTHPSGQCSL